MYVEIPHSVGTYWTWTAGYITILDFVWFLMLLAYIFTRAKSDWRLPHINAAIALAVLIFGQGVMRAVGWVWALGYHLGTPWDADALIVGTTIATIGLMCCIRAFSGPFMSRVGWAWGVTAAAAISSAALASSYVLKAIH